MSSRSTKQRLTAAASRRRSRRHGPDESEDEGSALILTLVFIIIVSFLVLPVMDYIMAVTRSNRVLVSRAERVEAVKGGLRAALVNPSQLYAACVNSGRTTSIALAVPPGLGISSKCTTTQDALQEVPSNLRWALTSIQSGSNASIPPPYVNPDPSSPELDGMISTAWCTSMTASPQLPCGKPYARNGDTDPTAWVNDTSTTSTGGKVFAPQLPPVKNTNWANTGYTLTGDAGPCRVFYPGKYADDLVITGSTPVYFASGVYYFEKTLRISGDANVVVGYGVAPGCIDSDAEAVGSIGSPNDAYSDGVGGTFVFGANGRFVVDTATAGGSAGASIIFNRRLMPSTDPLSALNDISIMSVNGVWNGTSTAALDLPAQLHVPVSLVAGATPTDPWSQRYKASTLVSTVTAPIPCAPPPTAVTAACPIIDFNFSTSAKVTVKIPGYVDVPQGSVSIRTQAAAAANKAITFGGGVLAAQVTVCGAAASVACQPTDLTVAPAFFQLGLLNPVVQKTFKITTTTTSGAPQIVSTALVQVNETGGYAVNSWVVTGA